MTAKESKAVAWLCDAGDGVNVNATSRPETRDDYARFNRTITPLVPESALHAAEAELAACEERRDHWHDYSVRRVEEIGTITAELGELRRRVGELADAVWPIPTEAMGSICISSDVFDLSQKQFIRQLLASDGGADGDNEGDSNA